MSWKKNLALGTAFVAATTTTIHMINKLVYFSATLDNLLSNPSGSFFEWKFGKIYYTKHGKGKPILLIHDLSTYSSAHEWNKIIKELSKKNTVYSLDLLGCGRSEKPNITYTSYLYVQLISDFIKHIIGEKTDIIATGISNSFVLAACQNDSSIINRIIMVNPSDIKILAKSPNKKSKTLAHIINLPVFGTFLYNILTRKSDIEALFHMDYFYNNSKVDNDLISTYYESAHSSNPNSKYLFASLIGYYTTINVRHCLKSLNNSIFIIKGNRNPEYADTAKQYTDILPSIEVIGIDDIKYLPQLEEPRKFIEQIDILFSSLEEPL